MSCPCAVADRLTLALQSAVRALRELHSATLDPAFSTSRLEQIERFAAEAIRLAQSETNCNTEPRAGAVLDPLVFASGNTMGQGGSKAPGTAGFAAPGQRAGGS